MLNDKTLWYPYLKHTFSSKFKSINNNASSHFLCKKSNILPHIQINISIFFEDNKFCKKQDISNIKI